LLSIGTNESYLGGIDFVINQRSLALACIFLDWLTLPFTELADSIEIGAVSQAPKLPKALVF